MEKEITNNDRAKIFSLYLNLESPIICTRIDDEDKTPLMLSGLDNFNEVVFVSDMDGGIDWHEPFDNIQLYLKPLSEISDEDAIEVIKIFNFDNPKIERFETYISGYDHTDEDVRINFDGSISDLDDGHNLLSSFEVLNAYDKLRELGYMIPYKGINLFDIGIAINQPKTQ